MPSLPRKARKGDDFKSYTVSAINKLIDYLHAMRPKDGPDIKVHETASGVQFDLAEKPKMTPQVASTGGGGTTYGIEATIDGSTASVALVEGGTASSVSIVPTAPITLSIGAGGELIIGSTASGGSGFGKPNWSNNILHISPGTAYSYQYDAWLAGSVSTSGVDMGHTIIYVMVNGIQFDLFQIPSDADGFYQQTSHVCIPIPANTQFSIGTYSGITTGVGSSLNLYSTL